MLIRGRELFGTSEDDAPELDHSEDSDNGKFSILSLIRIAAKLA